MYDIIKLYNEGLSISKISKILNINRQKISTTLKDNNIDIRSKTFHSRKYVFDEHYFDNIDCEYKAYILGFIYADGTNYYAKNYISIQLAKKDEDILKKISDIIYGKEVLWYNTVIRNSKSFDYVRFKMCSEHLSKKMIELGVEDNKSYKIKFPTWLDKNLYRHFIRGLIDGDGWINLSDKSPSTGLICSTSINEFLKDLFEKELKINSYICKSNKQDILTMCDLKIKNYYNNKILLDYLYKDATIFLQRKYDIYLKFLEKYDSMGYRYKVQSKQYEYLNK